MASSGLLEVWWIPLLSGGAAVALAAGMVAAFVRSARRLARQPRNPRPVAYPPDAPSAAVRDYWANWYVEREKYERDEVDYSPWLPLLLRLQADRPIGSVLSLGAGLNAEPLIWAECGFTVLATDLSPQVISERRRMTTERRAEIVREVGAKRASLRAIPARPGGSVEWLEGDLRDPAFAPGPFDVVEISRTLQYYMLMDQDSITAAEEEALIRVTDRVAPGGTLLIGMHNGAHAEMRCVQWLLSQGWEVAFWNGSDEPNRCEPKWARELPRDGRFAILRCATG